MQSMYKDQIQGSGKFFEDEAKKLSTGFKKPNTVLNKDSKFSDKHVKIEWFADGVLNASYNCLDRHVENGDGQKVAFYWEPDSPADNSREITYSELLEF